MTYTKLIISICVLCFNSYAKNPNRFFQSVAKNNYIHCQGPSPESSYYLTTNSTSSSGTITQEGANIFGSQGSELAKFKVLSITPSQIFIHLKHLSVHANINETLQISINRTTYVYKSDKEIAYAVDFQNKLGLYFCKYFESL